MRLAASAAKLVAVCDADGILAVRKGRAVTLAVSASVGPEGVADRVSLVLVRNGGPARTG